MDTHIPPFPQLDDPEAAVSARLPGEPKFGQVHSEVPRRPGATSGDAGLPPPPAAAPPSAVIRKHRSGLLAGVAIAVVGLAGGAFLISPYNHVISVPVAVKSEVQRLAAHAGVDLDKPFAPAASLAGVNLSARPSEVVAPRYEPKSRDQNLREVLAMRPGSGEPGSALVQASSAPHSLPSRAATGAGARTPATPAAAENTAREPGAALAPQAVIAPVVAAPPAAVLPSANDITPAVTAAALAHTAPTAATVDSSPMEESHPAAAATAAPAASAPYTLATAALDPAALPVPLHTAPVAAAPLPDPVGRALQLRSAPMADEEQVKVLELVTQMAALVRELKTQNTALRQDFAKTTADNKARMADFERRINLAEARTAVAAATTAEDAPVPLPAPAEPQAQVRRAIATVPVSLTSPVSLTRIDPAIPSVPPGDAKRYRVQAASPGLALLTEVARGGGDGAQIQITVGDKIPGWGVVKSVAQKGTAWVVSTERGVIE